MTLPRLLRSALAGAAALAAAATLSACGDTGFVNARDALPAGGSAAAAAALPPGGLGTGVTTVGTVVTSDGYTLYRFAKDQHDPSKSACTGTCETTWPPVHGDGQPALQGIPSGLVGTVGRPDGTQQLTLGGWPLYRYSGDTKPGQANGEGVGGAWAAVGANGSPAAQGPGASPATAPGSVPAGSLGAVPATGAPAPAGVGY